MTTCSKWLKHSGVVVCSCSQWFRLDLGYYLNNKSCFIWCEILPWKQLGHIFSDVPEIINIIPPTSGDPTRADHTLASKQRWSTDRSSQSDVATAPPPCDPPRELSALSLEPALRRPTALHPVQQCWCYAVWNLELASSKSTCRSQFWVRQRSSCSDVAFCCCSWPEYWKGLWQVASAAVHLPGVSFPKVFGAAAQDVLDIAFPSAEKPC